MSGARDDGFTLVEVLISLFIFSLISTGAYLALASTLDAREAAEARIDELEALSATRRLLADDIGTSVLRRNRDGLGGWERDVALTDPDRLVLTRRARSNPGGAFPRGDLMRVEWLVENGQLVRRFLPHENPAQLAPPVSRVVLDGVERIEVARVLSRSAVQALMAQVDTPNDPLSEALILLQRQQGEFPETGIIEVRLFHDDDTETRHVFEWNAAA